MKKIKSLGFGAAVVAGTVLAIIALKFTPLACLLIAAVVGVSYWHYKGGVC
jgi:hypothetical protein